MPSTLHFSDGLELAVTAELHDLDGPLRDGDAIALERFAGFRGSEPAGGGSVIVRMAAVAYAEAVGTP
jgi:hypothetical protein